MDYIFKSRKVNYIIFTLVILLLFYALTYIPHNLLNINSDNVSKITIFNGNTGNQIEVTNNNDIKHIINNLSSIRFKKDKLSLFYLGYSFRTTIYDNDGKIINELIINSDDTIRYKGFFYRAKNKKIDYDYIDNLLKK